MFRICIIIFVGITLSCEERIRDNPFDKYNTLSPLEWSPFNLEVERKSINEAILTWEYGDFNIEGFKIFRKTFEGAHVELASIGEERRLYNDSTLIGSDTVTYYYRMYAFAGSNLSGSIEKKLVEGRPQAVDVLSVTYDLEKMTVTWEKSSEQDFESYELLYAPTQSGKKSIVATIGNVDAQSYTIHQFDPTKENWYWIKVINNFGFTNIGKGKPNTIDSPPIQSELYPVELKDGSYHISWSKNNESDFKSYTVYEATYEDMSGKTETTTTTDTTYVRSIENNQIKYYQIQVEDVWGLQSISNTQEGNSYIRFVKSFGGSEDEHGNSVQQTTDGGYIITGSTRSFGSGDFDVWLIKANSQGEEEWNQTFGGNLREHGRSVQQTDDGGYLIVGETRSFGSDDYDVWLIKTDSNGNEEWNQTYDNDNSQDRGHSVQQTTDGGYIIVGGANPSNFSQTWIIKTDSQGNQEWNSVYDYGIGFSIKQTTDDGYIIIGTGLFKIDSEGNEEWANEAISGYSIQQTTDGGYIITGQNSYDVSLTKTDSQGQEEWNQIFGGSEEDGGFSVQQTTDGGYIITGYTDSFGNGNNDVWLIKTNSQGQEEWNKTFGGSKTDRGHSVQQTTDGGYIITGFSDSFGLWLIKTDPNGNTVDYK